MERDIRLGELGRQEIKERIEKVWNNNAPIYLLIRRAFGNRVFGKAYRERLRIHKGIILDVQGNEMGESSDYLRLSLEYCETRIDILMYKSEVREVKKMVWDEIEKCLIPIVW